jgi:hypothetical protein
MGGETMSVREIRQKSPIPIYAAAAVWALSGLLLPTYRLWHFLPPVVLAVAAYLLTTRLFPGAVGYVETPERFTRTGDGKIDALLRDGESAVAQMLRCREASGDVAIKAKIAEIAEITVKIYKDVLDDPSDYAQIRRFADIFIPETLKILSSYPMLESSGAGGDSVEAAKSRVIHVLDTILESYKKQFDALFNNQVLDIEIDVKVLETLLKREGLTGSDFETAK